MKILLFFTILMTTQTWASDCPSSIKGASVTLSIDNETHLAINSTLMCGSKAYLPQKFVDADVELWKKGEKIGAFYARRVTYSAQSQLLMLNQTIIKEAKKNLTDTPLMIIDLKRNMVTTSQNSLMF